METTEAPGRLYRVDVGGAIYWVVAAAEADVLPLLVAECEDEIEGEEEVSVRELSEAEGRKVRFIEDDGSSRWTMWDVAGQAWVEKGADVLGCSEW